MRVGRIGAVGKATGRVQVHSELVSAGVPAAVKQAWELPSGPRSTT